ncbi:MULTISPECIES: DUF4249 family protein [Sphingobacterium]|uniref:DUF4249 family protein n=1 Tax=Sphingobacterium TaxID=28453 RepID=UPI0013DC1759|nr:MULTISPECIES: DUF4249 family protein [unclassified Sphingobacterium]
MMLRKFCRNIWTVLCATVSLVGCTDHKTTISFEFPEYTPRLIVLSSVGTISGGEASISWSRPLRGQSGVVPELPKLSVFLLEEGVRIIKFSEVSDSAGYFAISPKDFSPKPGTGYAIEILMEEKAERITSEKCYLPEKPVLTDVKIELNPHLPSSYTLNWSQGAAKEGIGATALCPFLIDDQGVMDTKQGLAAYYLSPEFRYTDGKPLQGREGEKRFDRQVKKDGGTTELAKEVDVRLAFLSPELSIFKKEIDQLGYLGESIFQTVRPLYSNIIGAEGIFGLYNETSVRANF